MDASQKKYNFNDKNRDNNNNVQKNITWRSPLVFSPATKFSPKIAYQNKMPHQEEFRFESGTQQTNKLERHKNVPNLVVNIIKTPKKQQTIKSRPECNPFPLRDKDYGDEEKEQEKDTSDDMDYSDIYSSPTLDRIKSSKKVKQCEPKSAMEYFSHFQRSDTPDKQAEVSKADSTQKQSVNDSAKEEKSDISKDSCQTFEIEGRSMYSSPDLVPKLQNEAARENRSHAHSQTIRNSQGYMDSMAVYADNPSKYHETSQKFYQPTENVIARPVSSPCSGCMNLQCTGNIYRRTEYQVPQRINPTEPSSSQVRNSRIPYIPQPVLPPYYSYRNEYDPLLQMNNNPNHSVYYPDAHQSHYIIRNIPSQYQAVRHMYSEVPEQFAHEPVHNKSFGYIPDLPEKDMMSYPDYGYPEHGYSQTASMHELEVNHTEHKPRSSCRGHQRPYVEDTMDNSMVVKSKFKHIPTQINDNLVEERLFNHNVPEIYSPRYSSQLMEQLVPKTKERSHNEDTSFPKSVSHYSEEFHPPVNHNAMYRFGESQGLSLPVMVPNYRQNIGHPRNVPEAYKCMTEQPMVEYIPQYTSPRRYGQHLPSQSSNDKEYVMQKFFHSLGYY
ncbi:unnamed protein product [Acanthoscelides obtectus]|nr:unnamed protein product [Acanthoscelides obtectus]CAK1667306.1 hypothetical protein AOBTE_LOCUS25767 [Acanthoscelides obtectus]